MKRKNTRGETLYAEIHRNRSGIDAGGIDYSLFDTSGLSDNDEYELATTALMLAEQIIGSIRLANKPDISEWEKRLYMAASK